MNIKEASEATHCFYSPHSNKWAEFQWSNTYDMFTYAVYSDLGQLEQGYMGLDAVQRRQEIEGWLFVGCL